MKRKNEEDTSEKKIKIDTGLFNKLIVIKNAINKLPMSQINDQEFMYQLKDIVGGIYNSISTDRKGTQIDDEIDFYFTHNQNELNGVNKKMKDSKEFMFRALERKVDPCLLYLFMTAKLKKNTTFMREFETKSNKTELGIVHELVEKHEFHHTQVNERFWKEKALCLKAMERKSSPYIYCYPTSHFQDLDFIRTLSHKHPNDQALRRLVPEDAFKDPEFCLNIACNVDAFDDFDSSLTKDLEFVKKLLLVNGIHAQHYMEPRGMKLSDPKYRLGFIVFIFEHLNDIPFFPFEQLPISGRSVRLPLQYILNHLKRSHTIFEVDGTEYHVPTWFCAGNSFLRKKTPKFHDLEVGVLKHDDITMIRINDKKYYAHPDRTKRQEKIGAFFKKFHSKPFQIQGSGFFPASRVMSDDDFYWNVCQTTKHTTTTDTNVVNKHNANMIKLFDSFLLTNDSFPWLRSKYKQEHVDIKFRFY